VHPAPCPLAPALALLTLLALPALAAATPPVLVDNTNVGAADQWGCGLDSSAPCLTVAYGVGSALALAGESGAAMATVHVQGGGNPYLGECGNLTPYTPPVIEVSGTPPCHADLMGRYELMPANASGGRPAYFLAVKDVWLWYSPDYIRWFIGALGSYNASFACADQALWPNMITATWLVHKGFMEWPYAPSVKAVLPPVPARGGGASTGSSNSGSSDSSGGSGHSGNNTALCNGTYPSKCGRGITISPNASLTVIGLDTSRGSGALVGAPVIDCEGQGRAFTLGESLARVGAAGAAGGMGVAPPAAGAPSGRTVATAGGKAGLLVLEGLVVRNGRAATTQALTSYSDGSGGAVWATRPGQGLALVLRRCTFENCSSSSHSRQAGCVAGGGAVFVLGAALDASGSNFTRCSSSGGYGGGAVHVSFLDQLSATGTLITLLGCRFRDTVSSSGGGAVSLVVGGATNPVITLSGCYFENTTSIGDEGGGAVRIEFEGLVSGVTTTLSACHFGSTLSSGGGGGAVFLSYGQAANATTSLSDCHFKNTVDNPDLAGSADSGRAQGGGAVLVEFAGDATSTVITLLGCHFETTVCSAGNGGGGALLILYLGDATSAMTTLSDCSFGNTTSRGLGPGGAVSIYYFGRATTGAAATVTDSAFTGCSSAAGGGGAIAITHVYAVAGSATAVVGNNVSASKAGSVGGALALSAPAGSTGVSLAVTRSRFTNNTADGGGGTGGALSLVLPEDMPQNLNFVANPNGYWPDYSPIFDNPCARCRSFPGCDGDYCPYFNAGSPGQEMGNPPVVPRQHEFRRWDHMSSNNTFTIRDSIFIDNRAKLSGGALAAGGGGTGLVDSCLFENNNTTLFGAGTYLSGTVQLNASRSVWRGNKCGQGGCQIYSSSGAGVDFSLNSSVELGCSGDDSESGSASCHAGVVAVQSGSWTWDVLSGMSCALGYKLVNSSAPAFKVTLDGWQLKSPVTVPSKCVPNSTGDLDSTGGGGGNPHDHCLVVDNVTNCPCYFGNSKNTGGFGSAAVIIPEMLASSLSYACIACAAGRSNPTRPWLNGSSANATAGTCIPCPAGQHQDESAQPTCKDCAANKHQDSEAGQKSCDVCAGGKFQPLPGQANCTECPKKGVTCSAGFPRQEKGWWRATENLTNSADLYTCEQAWVCLGSAEQEEAGCTGAVGKSCLPPRDAQCAVGYAGPVCALCAPGYLVQSGECHSCTHLDAPSIVGIVALGFFVCVSCTFVYRNRDSPWLDNTILKTVLSFYQLVSIMERSFTVQWPPLFRNAVQAVKLALASVADLPSTACAFEVDWFGRLYIWTLGMLAVALALWGRSCWRRPPVGGAGVAQLQRNLFYLAFFCYPLAAPVIVSIFRCRTVAGVAHLEADFTLTCDGGSYALAAVWAALWTVGFVLGFPAAMTLALHRRHEAVEFISGAYATQQFWPRYWEVVDSVKKLLLSSAVLFVPQGSNLRIAFALLVSVAFQLLQALHQPYTSASSNRVADAAGVALSLTYFIGLLIASQPDTGACAQLGTLGVVLILLLVSVALAAVVALVALRKQVAHRPRREKGGGGGRGTVLGEPLLPCRHFAGK
jgi:hypothetical protein